MRINNRMTRRLDRGIFALGLALAVSAGGSAVVAEEGRPIPRLGEAGPDAAPWTWDGPALYAAALMGMDRSPDEEGEETAARFRAGWNAQGLRLLVEVLDPTPREEFEIYEGDSVEIILAREYRSGRDRLQYIVGPGRTTPMPDPRIQFYDWRSWDRRDPTSVPPYEARADDDGYAVNLWIPWSFLGVEPEEGLELGLQIQVNDGSDRGRRQRRWSPYPGGGDGERRLHAVRLAGPEAVEPERVAVMRSYDRGDGLAMRVSAEGAFGGQTVQVFLDDHPLGALTMAPARAGWTEGVFVQPALELEGERFRDFRLVFEDGISVAVPYRIALPTQRILGDPWRGENYGINDAFRYAMECMGEGRGHTYAFFSGVIGDTFLQIHPRTPGRWLGSLSDLFPVERTLAPAFEACGYAFRIVDGEDVQADPARWFDEIAASIDRGVPVIRYQHRTWYYGRPLVVGYEGDGRTLLCAPSNRNDPVAFPVDLDDIGSLVFFGEKRDRPTLADAYRHALERVPALLRRPEEDGYLFGRAAYDAWADGLADPAVRQGLMDGTLDWWNTQGAAICLTATNNHHVRDFLNEAKTLNPDLAPTVDGLVAVYERMYDVQRRLEAAKGGFALQQDTLGDPEAMARVVAILREYGPLCDRLLAVFEDPDAARAEAEAPPVNHAPAGEGGDGVGDGEGDPRPTDLF